MDDSKRSKKRKRDSGKAASTRSDAHVDTSKPTAVFQPQAGRDWTVSVALPGSIIANAQSHDLKTTLAGQIARALAVFCVDEVVVFDDGTQVQSTENRLRHLNDKQRQLAAESEANGYTAFSDPNQFLYHLLSYLETPPYLRRELFPFHPNLRTAGSLPSLDMPHHLRADEWCPYREGVTVGPKSGGHHTTNGGFKANGKASKSHMTRSPEAVARTLVNTGLSNPVEVPGDIPPNTRVTVKFDDLRGSALESATLSAAPVAPEAPRQDSGYYWGYSVRSAPSLESIFTESQFEEGYDFCIGTSERGKSVEDLDLAGKPAGSWNHLLICFGGVAGLEKALENDRGLQAKGVTEAEQMFDAWVNLVEGQGSRTIRTEEAVWIGLMGLSGFVKRSHAWSR